MTKEEKRIKNISITALDLFCELRDRCYGDDSTTEFDRLHDDLYYQASGLSESISMFHEDLDSNHDVSGWEAEFRDALKLAKDIDKYWKQLQKLSTLSTRNFNWIYC